MIDNPILATDSYKLTHWKQYPLGTEYVYSYFESRPGAKFDHTVFFGLQTILYEVCDKVITPTRIDQAGRLSKAHFGTDDIFNYAGWQHILLEHGGKLPLEIRAVPEGTHVKVSNVIMTVTNTCDECFWVTNAFESLLTHVWYPSTVCTLSNAVRQMLTKALRRSSENPDVVDFMLHDFGYRGATTHDAAAIGGAAHLVNFKGTDTLPAILLAETDYGQEFAGCAYSVPATEHSVMTSLGRDGEDAVVTRLLDAYPTGILSVVGDSYDIFDFARRMGTTFYEHIMARDGVFVLRPDSITPNYPTPAMVVLRLLDMFHEYFGSTVNNKGFRVLDPHVRIIWGDGIDMDGIKFILDSVMDHGFSAENLVFGMGGGLLQKVNRDTQRFAFKASAVRVDGQWHDVYKKPLDPSKTSKAGHLALVAGKTIHVEAGYVGPDQLELVFRDGRMHRRQSFGDIRKLAQAGPVHMYET